MTLAGSCQCGGIHYQISGSFEFIGNCHCSICRKSHGAAYATWGIIDPEQFRWSAGRDLLESYQSSPGRHRHFCRKCGSPLASSHQGKVSEIVIGSIDGDPGARPKEHIFVSSKAPWHAISDKLPQHGQWPPGMDA